MIKRFVAQRQQGLILLSLLFVLIAELAMSAPYAAMVMDARTGQILHSRNADARLHPASLTKMMTLYIAFEAVKRGEISLDTRVKISRNAASEPPSKLGLRTGQRIKLRYLIRAAAIKSANDAATAIAEAISGSEAKFAKRMTRTARAIGMRKTTLKNAHGLTQSGHLSSARDMTLLGRQLLFDYPQYYNLFSRKSSFAGVKKVYNTNHRLLKSYRGADGIKTGYTRAAGSNLVASAKRGKKRIIATVFGGRSSIDRNKKVSALLDMGFKRAPRRARTQAPASPRHYAQKPMSKLKARLPKKLMRGALRPKLRPKNLRIAKAKPSKATESKKPQDTLPDLRDEVADALDTARVDVVKDAAQANVKSASLFLTTTETRPKTRPEGVANEISKNARDNTQQKRPKTRVITRPVDAFAGGKWGINLGKYPNRFAAEKALLQTALLENSSLDGAQREVIDRKNGYEATFLGLSRDEADLACRRLQARKRACFMISPG